MKINPLDSPDCRAIKYIIYALPPMLAIAGWLTLSLLIVGL